HHFLFAVVNGDIDWNDGSYAGVRLFQQLELVPERFDDEPAKLPWKSRNEREERIGEDTVVGADLHEHNRTGRRCQPLFEQLRKERAAALARSLQLVAKFVQDDIETPLAPAKRLPDCTARVIVHVESR